MDTETASLLREKGVDEAWGVIIEAPDRDDVHPIAEVTVDDPENPDRQRALFLGEDPEAERSTDRSFEIQGEDRFRQMVTDDRNGGIAYYLSMLEQHEVDEAEALAAMEDLADMDAYEDWQQSMSPSDRRLRLLDQAEERAAFGGINVETYLEDGGTFRSLGLSDGARRVALNLAGSIDPNPRRCYENAYRAVTEYDGTRDVQYVEGLAMPKHPGRISTHAWIEIDGKVADLTWPWHSPDPPAETVYFGIAVDEETLRERMANRPGTSNPVVVDLETLEQMASEQ